jgi:hypothetical protein
MGCPADVENSLSMSQLALGLVRWLLRLLGAALIAIVLGAVAAVYLAVDRQPLVTTLVHFTPEHIARAKLLLDRNDPRRLRQGEVRTIAVSQEDLDLAINYAASRLGRGAASAVLQDGSATVRLTVMLPSNPLGNYLNLTAVLVEAQDLPRLDELRLGRLPIPRQLAEWALGQGVAYTPGGADYVRALQQVLKRVVLRKNQLTVVYKWDDQLPDRLRSALVPAETVARAKAYQTRLAELIRPPATGRMSLSSLLQPLMELARQRSAESGNAVEENQAAILILTLYVNGRDLATLVPAARNWPIPGPGRVALGGRDDFAQHFTISAALSATSGSPLAEAVGLYKEVEDSRGGSGFSFNDIAADLAGTRFGQLATTSEKDAIALQGRFAQAILDADLLPKVSDLPEFMSDSEFKRRYGGIGLPAYNAMMRDIDMRLSALPLYH